MWKKRGERRKLVRTEAMEPAPHSWYYYTKGLYRLQLGSYFVAPKRNTSFLAAEVTKSKKTKIYSLHSFVLRTRTIKVIISTTIKITNMTEVTTITKKNIQTQF